AETKRVHPVSPPLPSLLNLPLLPLAPTFTRGLVSARQCIRPRDAPRRDVAIAAALSSNLNGLGILPRRSPTSLLFHGITHGVSYTAPTFHAGMHANQPIDRLLAMKPNS
ncbi:hypothetical protein CVT26_009674, partial [Gymnopilus dilepis]